MIGIDIDGVLFPWDDCARDALVSRFGIERPGPSTTWTYLKDVIEHEQWTWLWSAEGQASVFGRMVVYPGAHQAFTAILRDPSHRCHFVTHRDPRYTANETAHFLTLHFGGHPWAGMHIVQRSVKKHALIPWDVFIDDKPETVYEMLAHTDALVFAPQRPWNTELADVISPRFLHYRDPLEVVERLGVEP